MVHGTSHTVGQLDWLPLTLPQCLRVVIGYAAIPQNPVSEHLQRTIRAERTAEYESGGDRDGGKRGAVVEEKRKVSSGGEKRKRFKLLFVPTLTGGEVEKLIHALLAGKGKSLPTKVMEIVQSECGAPNSMGAVQNSAFALPAPRAPRANSLYVATVMEELEVDGGFHTLEQDALSLIQRSADLGYLYASVLQRWETKAADSGKLRETLTLLCVAKEGLHESELLSLTGMDQMVWLQMKRMIVGQHVTVQNGFLYLQRFAMRLAIRRRYLSSASAMQQQRQRSQGRVGDPSHRAVEQQNQWETEGRHENLKSGEHDEQLVERELGLLTKLRDFFAPLRTFRESDMYLAMLIEIEKRSGLGNSTQVDREGWGPAEEKGERERETD